MPLNTQYVKLTETFAYYCADEGNPHSKHMPVLYQFAAYQAWSSNKCIIEIGNTCISTTVSLLMSGVPVHVFIESPKPTIVALNRMAGEYLDLLSLRTFPLLQVREFNGRLPGFVLINDSDSMDFCLPLSQHPLRNANTLAEIANRATQYIGITCTAERYKEIKGILKLIPKWEQLQWRLVYEDVAKRNNVLVVWERVN